MSPVGRLYRTLYWSGVASAILAVAIAAYLALVWRRLPTLPATAGKGSISPPSWPVIASNTTGDWSVLVSSSSDTNERASDPSTLFRLVGTFFQIPEKGTNEVRKAILDDVVAGTQHIVSEGDALAGTRVVGIYGDHVVIHDGAGDHTLRLRFTRGAGTAGSDTNAPGALTDARGRFGIRQVGPNRYVFSRDPLMQYYKELMDQPERLVRVFDSLKPSYTPQGKIDGYRLNVEGEGDFFDAAGLQENDTVRAVNSLPMTSRQRAEFFIKQFVADRANAIVLEVERDGSRRKLIYEVR